MENETLVINNLGLFNNTLGNLAKGEGFWTQDIIAFRELVEGIPHGCSCNRQKRIDKARELYVKIAKELTPEQVEDIKKYNEIEKIIITLDNDTINEF